MHKRKRVVVAMSGGVDSSAAAALLKEEGYEVIGISMQLYDHSKKEDSRFDSCCSLKEVDMVKRVAQILDIPYYVLDFEEVFKEKVVNYFVDEYLKARTPNPCVKCNEDVKFKHLIQKAKELKADYLATGHYVKNEYDKNTGSYRLLRAKDRKKDQSYFLFGTAKKELPFLLFPLGNLEKSQVRQVAQKAGLPNAQKKESMEICFIPNNNYSEFVVEQLTLREEKNKLSGKFATREGKIIGEHNGYFKYTVGQRRGLGLSNPNPLYVLGVNSSTKEVILGKNADLFSQGLLAKNINWISLPHGSDITCKIRHGSKEIESQLELNFQDHLQQKEGRFQSPQIKILFKTQQKAVTPGQAVVFYEGDVLLGGGWIEYALH